MDLEWILGVFFTGFWMDFGWLLGGLFYRILDGFWMDFGVSFGWILGVFFTGFWMDFGWIWDGFWIVFLSGFWMDFKWILVGFGNIFDGFRMDFCCIWDGWLACQPAGWLAGRLAGWLAGWRRWLVWAGWNVLRWSGQGWAGLGWASRGGSEAGCWRRYDKQKMSNACGGTTATRPVFWYITLAQKMFRSVPTFVPSGPAIEKFVHDSASFTHAFK